MSLVHAVLLLSVGACAMASKAPCVPDSRPLPEHFLIRADTSAPGTIRGVIRQLRDSQAIKSVIVRTTEGSRQTTTNDLGYFELTGVPTGSVTLHVALIGYYPATVPVELPEQNGVILLGFLGWSCPQWVF